MKGAYQYLTLIGLVLGSLLSQLPISTTVTALDRCQYPNNEHLLSGGLRTQPDLIPGCLLPHPSLSFVVVAFIYFVFIA